MRTVQRSEILDFLTYAERREALRAEVLAIKAVRRAHLGPYLTFLFENADTVRYQVLEMVRVEQMVRESEIEHELETYNALLGGPGELGCTLLFEIDDEQARPELLRRWRDLPRAIRMVFEDGSEAPAAVDEEQFNEDKASSVQFLKFQVGARMPRGLRVDHGDYQAEVDFHEATKAALRADLAG